MANESNSVLIVGFNTRPLAYSLKKNGYKVYTVDFFGDLDLYPYVEDCIVVLKELEANYNSLKDKYSRYLAEFAIILHRKYRDVNFLLIGSGLDDALEERKLILDEIKNFSTVSVNNSLDTIIKARNIDLIFRFLNLQEFRTPKSYSYEIFPSGKFPLEYPFILKKKRSAGGINVYKIQDRANFTSLLKILKKKVFIPSEWLIQEYIKGIPVSCTVISNGKECEIISINRQIIGEKFLNSPQECIYCGNIVPAGLPISDNKLISEISVKLTKELGLKGINGFDFVLRDHYPYLMEINPRIPGSISASESVLNLNLLDLHIKSFEPNEWDNVKRIISSTKTNSFATKFVLFAPKDIDKNTLSKINNLKFVHDKSEPIRKVLKGEPLCTVLYKAKNLSESYNGAKMIVIKIDKIIG